ncbi:hypothetical protein BHM03_00041825 [Ensete ventricosum]|nr:hypothetical protein BHM03_00041825 [Ensete ventricosum]
MGTGGTTAGANSVITESHPENRVWVKLAKRSPEACRRRSGDCHDNAREFARRRPRLAGRLSRVAEKLVGSWLLLSAAPLAPVVALPIRGFFENLRRSRGRLTFTDGHVWVPHGLGKIS